MRLINARTLQLEVFNDHRCQPKYAILSHRWIDGQEVSFEEFPSVLPDNNNKECKTGWAKIYFCCRQVLEDELDYIWIDTCCIDKSSSAELTEAINSMFKWYQSAVCCYAYLYDVEEDSVKGFAASSWFTRAWTLQELIANKHVKFFLSDFSYSGTKLELRSRLSRITGVDYAVLGDPTLLRRRPVAERMAWAAKREATRIEDIAYSLFGIFQVNLPLLYGEGQRSFTRLQEEIIRQTADQSIFAWDSPGNGPCDLLAESPRDFSHCNVIAWTHSDRAQPYSLTNTGLSINLQLIPYSLNVWAAFLTCHRIDDRDCCIFLSRVRGQRNLWHRVRFQNHASSSLADMPDSDNSYEQSIQRRLQSTARERSTWQKLLITSSALSFDNLNGEKHDEITSPRSETGLGSSHVSEPLYGMILDAPLLTRFDHVTFCPYALIAVFDWDMNSRIYNTARERFLKDRTAAWASRIIEAVPQLYDEALVKPAVYGTTPVGVFVTRHLTVGMTGALLLDADTVGLEAIVLGFHPDFFQPMVLLIMKGSSLDIASIRKWAHPYRSLDEFHMNYKNVNGLPDLQNLTREIFAMPLTAGKNETQIDHIDHVQVLIVPKDKDYKDWCVKPDLDANWFLSIRLSMERSESYLYWKCSVEKRNIEVEIRISSHD